MKDLSVYKVGDVASFTEHPGPDWLPCSGQWVSQDEYRELFSVLGTKWGEVGALFRVPPLDGETYIRAQESKDSTDTVVESESAVATTSAVRTRSGVLLREGGKQKPHECSFPALPYAFVDTSKKGQVWMCLVCHRVYVTVEGRGVSVHSPAWVWERLEPWDEWRWRRRWRKIQRKKKI